MNQKKLGNDLVESESINKALLNRELSSEPMEKLNSDLKKEKLNSILLMLMLLLKKLVLIIRLVRLWKLLSLRFVK